MCNCKAAGCDAMMCNCSCHKYQPEPAAPHPHEWTITQWMTCGPSPLGERFGDQHGAEVAAICAMHGCYARMDIGQIVAAINAPPPTTEDMNTASVHYKAGWAAGNVTADPTLHRDIAAILDYVSIRANIQTANELLATYHEAVIDMYTRLASGPAVMEPGLRRGQCDSRHPDQPDVRCALYAVQHPTIGEHFDGNGHDWPVASGPKGNRELPVDTRR